MSLATTVVSFGEWMPDQSDFGQAGVTRAENVTFYDGAYQPYQPFTANAQTITGLVSPGISALDVSGNQYLYVAAGGSIQRGQNNGINWTAVATSSGISSLAQFDNFIISVATATTAKAGTVGSVSLFTDLATSGGMTYPFASVVDVVNRFVVLGSLSTTSGTPEVPHGIYWSAIDDPRKWPTPNSATAIATQSGFQELSQEYGNVQAIHGGDQYAIILQEGAVTRMTYVGPPVVFQFDVIDKTNGAAFNKGSINVGGIVYFVSRTGFFKTDGVNVVPIGDGKVDRYFWDNYSASNASFDTNCWGYNADKNLLYFGYSTSSSANLDSLLIYNPVSNNWTYAREPSGFRRLISAATGGDYAGNLYAFSGATDGVCGSFSGTPGTAIITTSEMELMPGGRAYVSGVKPNILSSGTAPAIAVRVGYRSDLSTTPTYTATTTPTTRTGFADVRVDAKYHRAEVQIVGQFSKTTGLEFKAAPSGEA